ncbi:MAG: YggT family protein [Holosporales bacterium]|jgi:YggT family protein|nr:YggT family protein [Holosporales bacterium]
MIVLALLIEVILGIADIIEYVLIGYIILGWVIFFGLVSNREGVIFRLYVFLMSKVEPVLSVIRRFLPAIAGLDFSPLVIFFGLHFAKIMLIRLFYALAYG